MRRFFDACTSNIGLRHSDSSTRQTDPVLSASQPHGPETPCLSAFAKSSHFLPVASPASGHVPPWRLREFFSLGYTLKEVVWFGWYMLCHTLTQHSTQPYSLWKDAIAGYNGACGKVVFTVRRHALARSLLSAGIRPSVRLSATFVYCIVSRRLKISSNIFLGPVAP